LNIFKTLEDWDFLENMGVKLPEEVIGPNCLKEDEMVCKYAWSLARCCAVGELKTQGFYSDRPPYGF
jgi:hypothetical protein